MEVNVFNKSDYTIESGSARQFSHYNPWALYTITAFFVIPLEQVPHKHPNPMKLRD